MELDFSMLNALKSQQKSPQEAVGATQAQPAINGHENQHSPTEPRRSPTEPYKQDGAGSLQHEADIRQSEREIQAEIQRSRQQGTKEAGELEIEIIKGIQEGEPVAALFLKAVKALSLLSGNTMLYKQVEQDLTGVYGAALHDPEPLELAIEATQNRLERLLQADWEEEDTQARERIRNAIKAHRERIERLQKKK